MSKELKLSQNVIIVDSGENGLGDFRVKVDTYIKKPFTSVASVEMTLTVKSAEFLISQLQSALELIGQDFIVHHNGQISITEDYLDTDYASIQNYLDKVPMVRD